MRSLAIIKKFLLALQGLEGCKINTRRSLLKLSQERVLFFCMASSILHAEISVKINIGALVLGYF